jgi:hypothetical protein
MIAGSHRTPAEIDIFEPDRVKPLIQAPQLRPDTPAEHQESTRGLFHLRGAIEILIEISIAPIHRI